MIACLTLALPCHWCVAQSVHCIRLLMHVFRQAAGIVDALDIFSDVICLICPAPFHDIALPFVAGLFVHYK